MPRPGSSPTTRPGSSPTTRPQGAITRGTTGINRLRRSDRWLVHHPEVQAVLAGAADPLVVDLGYGAMPTTTLELASRLRTVRKDVRVVGLEIDPARVVPPRDGVHFGLGGFELAGHTPVLVRAFNVLRQYPESEVAQAWTMMAARLAPGGLIIEGTCDELGRRCAWLLLDASGPRTLTLACDPFDIGKPSDLAERLPKALIHQNVPGQPIHDLLAAADRCWASAAPHGVFGPRVRWRMMLKSLRDNGFPVEPQRRQVRDCILTTPWAAVAPLA
ncbi:class I SAM-dependent methyltransferase [Mycobacteroides chelonae]|uniref:class I SAM-dependent methyltransferase n=1 Tax=Mycobacteroides chelonae TaxID=1774 RepID=UPI0019110D6B|nr:class I SAM-dependent methyltransferase [Mycobacteroides chelonae]QQG99997.1 class I SAM-dependent methyltransferase [Mycobacteroides chelonae]